MFTILLIGLKFASRGLSAIAELLVILAQVHVGVKFAYGWHRLSYTSSWKMPQTEYKFKSGECGSYALV